MNFGAPERKGSWALGEGRGGEGKKRVCALDRSSDGDRKESYLQVVTIPVPTRGLLATISLQGDGRILTEARGDDNWGVACEESIDLPGFGSGCDPVVEALNNEIVKLSEELQVEPYGGVDAAGRAK